MDGATTVSPLKHALAMAARGWRVFPVKGKRPLTPNGFKDATTDPGILKQYWKRWPEAGVAIATGPQSGLWVLDIDGPEADDELMALELEHGEIPPTIEVETGKGRHLYFAWNGKRVQNSAGKVAPGIDVRGDGGYVVTASSRHPSGRRYRFTEAGHPKNHERPADPPGWLLDLVTRDEARKPKAPVSVDSIPEGSRNSTLASLAGTMRARGMAEDSILAALEEENARRCAPPLAHAEVARIAASYGNYPPGPLEDHHHGDDGHGHYTLTDTGNASRLVEMHGERLHYIAPWGKWLVWDDVSGRWDLDHRDIGVRELAKDVGHKLKADAAAEPDEERAKKMFTFGLRSLSAHGIGSMVDLARGIHGIPLDHELLDSDPWVLGVENGVVDLRTGKLRASDPSDLMTFQAPVRWDENAEAPRWEKALEEWFPDPDVRSYVHRLAGSALVGAQRDHVFVIHYGHGRNGKGTFTRALFRALGPYAVVIHLSLLVEQRYSQHDTVKAELFRRRLAVASETQRRVRMDEANVKNLTGNDRITARRMREDPWEFDPSHSLWLQTNHLPEIGGRDRGIWSRIRVVKWETTFGDTEQDPDLDETLAREVPGILRWLVDGCLAWQQEGLAEPEAVIRETLAYRNSEDVFSRFAVDAGLAFGDGFEIQASEIQEILGEWAQAEGITAPSRELGSWLREQGATQTRRRWKDSSGKQRQARFWVGVGLADGKHESTQVELAA